MWVLLSPSFLVLKVDLFYHSSIAIDRASWRFGYPPSFMLSRPSPIGHQSSVTIPKSSKCSTSMKIELRLYVAHVVFVFRRQSVCLKMTARGNKCTVRLWSCLACFKKMRITFFQSGSNVRTGHLTPDVIDVHSMQPLNSP